jgi:DNA-binding PadR family transcriptional regulator
MKLKESIARALKYCELTEYQLITIIEIATNKVGKINSCDLTNMLQEMIQKGLVTVVEDKYKLTLKGQDEVLNFYEERDRALSEGYKMFK